MTETRFTSSADWVEWRNSQIAMIVGLLKAAQAAGVTWNGHTPIDGLIALPDLMDWPREEMRKVAAVADEGMPGLSGATKSGPVEAS